jgi:hypothetical protein
MSMSMLKAEIVERNGINGKLAHVTSSYVINARTTKSRIRKFNPLFHIVLVLVQYPL